MHLNPTVPIVTLNVNGLYLMARTQRNIKDKYIYTTITREVK